MGNTSSNPNCIPRPGLVLGAYPERGNTRDRQLDELYDRVRSHVVSRWRYRATSLRRVASCIDRESRFLSAQTDEALSAHVRDLRARLVRAGLCDEQLAMQAFALVREMSDRKLGMRHYDSQVQGGWVMYHGQIAEMQTGEGKTLAATLPVATAAMAAVPVHVITTNDYLATRDAAAMRPLYEALGLSVGIVTEGMDADARRIAYACDITYCTNKQVAFDYLRDRVARGTACSKLKLDMERFNEGASRGRRLMLRGLCFAIVDEADSVLVDEARTPLVLSEPVVADASMHAVYRQALELADALTEGDDFQVIEMERRVALAPRGCARLADMVESMASRRDTARRREELVQQALCARHVYLRDRDYVVRDGRVQIVDGNTGRVLADRSWERGLHQMIEFKERCKPSDDKATLARMSYQCFYRRYHRLAGMTGTAREVEREVGEVYGLSVVRISPHCPSRRIAIPEQVFLRAEDASNAIIASAREQAARGRPVLIGTRSVCKSEQFAQRLAQSGLEVQVLNARQDAQEASIIADAGMRGKITVATNMAGRGTDILLGPGAQGCGGLHVIVTERNDSARVDRQLTGRCARQGDPGSYQGFSSLEDDLPRLHGSDLLSKSVSVFAHDPHQQLPHWLGSKILNIAQRRLERQHEQMRRQVDLENKQLNLVLSFTGASQ